MKESKILVQETNGSVVSDAAVNILQGEARNVAELSRKVGQLEGQLSVANSRAMDLEQQLQNQEKQVTVTVRMDGDGSDNSVIKYDPWSRFWKTTTSSRKTAYIDKIKTINMDDLATLVNNAVKDEADQLVKDADKEIQKANKKAEDAEKILKTYKEDYSNQLKQLDEKVKKAVERAEKNNLETINELKIEVSRKDKQLESNARELKLFVEERDLLLESMNVELDFLRKHVELLKTKPADLFNKLRNIFVTYRYNRRIKSTLHV